MSSLLEEGELEDGHRAPTSEVGYESQPQPPYSPQPPSRASYYSYGPEDGRYRNIRTEEFNTQERSLGHSSSNVLGDNTRTPSNQQLHDLLQNLAMCLPSNSSRVIKLPKFEPEENDPKSWLQTVEACFYDYPCSGSNLIIALSTALTGTAARWLSRMTHPKLTWPEFKEAFSTEYIITQTPSSLISSQLSTSPKDEESYVSYATQMLGTLDSCFNSMTKQEISIALVLAQMEKFDKRIQHLSCTSDIRTREELLRELRFFSFGKRKYSPQDSTLPDPKRSKFSDRSLSSRPYCQHCRIPGHSIQDCRRKRSQVPSPHTSSSRRSAPSVKTPPIQPARRGVCFVCHSKDHYADRCPKRQPTVSKTSESPRGRFPAHQVNQCVVNPTGSLTHQGKQHCFVFDSGSECSLLRSTIQNEFSGPVFKTPVILGGIAHARLTCNAQKVSEVIIDGISLNICFHIVPDHSISGNIIIGREILGMGVKVNITANKCELRPCDLHISKSIAKRYNLEIENVSHKGLDEVLPNLSDISETTSVGTHPVVTEPVVTDPVRIEPVGTNTQAPIEHYPIDKVVESISHYFDSETTTSDSNNFTTQIDINRKPELLAILNKYKDSFTEGFPTKRVTTGELQIRLKDPSKLVHRRPYPLSPTDKKIVRDHIAELEQAGIVRKSQSPFASPILLVPKKNGKVRMCVDYRHLNSNTVAEHHPLPLIKDQIARLAGCRYFTTLDMASGYHAIPVHADSVEKTSFVTPEGQFEYLTMPFGLKCGPSVYQRCVTAALGPLANECCTAFIDDIMIFSKTIDEALESLDKVLDALTKSGFSLNPSKCSFVMEKVLYLGYEVSAGEIRPNSKKIESLVSLPPPSNVSSLRQFIGLASYFRQFIPNFCTIAAPLYKLLDSKSNLIWLPEHEDARKKLISHLTNEPVLMIFDPSFPIELHCDACSIGYAGILVQIVDKKPRVVAYFSKRTTAAESKYHSYELETLAVIQSIRHFQTYLQYCSFTVVTDCKSLKESYLKQDLNTRVHRWWSFMQAFDFQVVYRPAAKMEHVDFLSRHPLPQNITTPSLPVRTFPPLLSAQSFNPDNCSKPAEKPAILRVDLTTLPDDWLMLAQRQDQDILKTLTKIQNNELPEDIRNTYEIRSGIVCRKIQRNNKTRCVPIVPHSYKWSVVNNVHEGIVHLGWEKTLEKVAEFYWFKNMAKFVRKFTENCLTCKVAKTPSGKTQVQLHPIPKTATPWHTIHIDITGKLSGKNDAREYLIVLIDAFTKYVLLYHTRKIDSDSVIRALKKSISLFAAPTRVIVDQGRCFTGTDFKDFCRRHQIDLHYIATGAARANSQVERVMSVLTNMLTATELGERSWQDAILDIQLAINLTINRVTRSSPLELLLGKVGRPLNMVIPTEAVTGSSTVDLDTLRDSADQNIIKSATYNKTHFDKGKAKIKPFSVGDLVFLQNEPRNQLKLSPKFRGPLQIVEVLEHDRYLLKALNSNRTYKYAHDKLKLAPNTSMSECDNDTDDVSSSDNENLI
ncbi:hypothetical protein M8J77_008825 [Diaphorina citri]|nr:hypothetical protein M8J77_008825 [Diaphorina citri]